MRVYLLAACYLLALRQTGKAELTIHTDFPGGSARVTALDSVAQSLAIAPTPFKNKGWDCWWYFRVEGLETNRPLTLTVKGMSFARPLRAMLSTDQLNWTHSPPATSADGAHRYTITPTTPTLWMAWGPPFTLTQASNLVHHAAKKVSDAKAFTLARSRENHAVPALRVGPDQPRHQIWIQARQHAWESGASWVCQGLITWLVSDDPAAHKLRRTTTVLLVPIMDADNVQRGAGGKNQFPQDHNRDWSEAPHWPEVAAAQQGIRNMDGDGNFVLFVDLHNPGPGDREPFFYLPPEELMSEQRQQRQALFLKQCNTHMANEALPFKGRTRVSGRGYDKNWDKISKNWVAGNTTGPAVAVTLETSWNTANSTLENYQKTGAALGRSIAGFIAALP